MDVLALFARASAILGGVGKTMVEAAVRHRRLATEASALWTLRLRDLGGSRWAIGAIYDGARGPQLRVLELRAVAPRGLELRHFRHRSIGYAVVEEPARGALAFSQDLELGTPSGVRAAASWPARSRGRGWLPRRPLRIELVVVAEECAGLRRRHRIRLRSEALPEA